MPNPVPIRPRRAKLSKETGAMALTIPIDFGNGPQYIKLGINLMSAPIDIFNDANALYARRRLEDAVRAALQGEVEARWNGGRNALNAPLDKVLSDLIEYKIKDTL